MKKKIRKYYPGVNGLTSNTSTNTYGVLAPKPEDPNKFSTGKFLFPQQETLGKIVNSEVFSPETLSKNAPSFADKAGAFMGNYGGAIASAASSIAPLLMKKPDPNAKPYKKGTKNLNSDMKRKKYEDGSDSLFNTAGPRMTNTPGENFGYTINPNPVKKTVVRQKPAMTAEMQRVARLQQKMRDAGYNIKVDGAWGKETQRIYDAYSKDVAADRARRGTVNTGQGPTIQNAENLREARALGARGTVLDQVTVTAPARKTYNEFDSPVLRQGNMEALGRWRAEDAKAQAIAEAKRKAREAEIARNSQSLPSDTEANKYSFNAGNKGQGTDVTAIQNEALLRNRLVGDGATSKGSSRIQYADGSKKVSGYKKLDMKLGGLLPGGVSRAEYKAAKNASKNATPEGKFGPMAGGYAQSTKSTEGVGPLAGGYSKPAADASKPAGPMTDIRRYTNADNMPAGSTASPAKKSLKAQYEENKGGYARALKSGKKDAQGNLVDPNTGLSYKKLPTKTGGTGTGKSTSTSKPSLFQGGKSTKNFKDPNSGISFYTNNRAFDEKNKKMGTYVHDPKTNKLNIKWDKAKTAPKRKGDDTYMDEVIDYGSRIAGSLGGAALAGGSTFGAGSVAGAIAGDRAGKAFGNWLNKKLGYREESDTSQEGYSLGEAGMAALGGGVGGRLVKPVGGALVKFVGKEGAKVAAAPLGRAVAATGRAAGKLVGRGGSKAAAATEQAAAQAGGKAAAQGASQSASQAAKITLKPGKFATTRGNGGRFTVNPAKQGKGTYTGPKAPAKGNPTPSKVNPGTSSKATTASSSTAQTPASAQGSVQGPAQANLRQSVSNATKAAGRKTKETGKKLITYANKNKKKVAVGAAGAGTLLGGGYAASQIRTGE